MPTCSTDMAEGTPAAAVERQRPSSSGRPTDATPEDAAVRDKCHEHLQELCLDLARATLRSPDIALFHESDHALYTHLADYFEHLKDRQAHEAAIAVTRAHAAFALRDVYANAHQSAAATNLAERSAMKALQESAASPSTSSDEAAELLARVANTAAGPLISQRSLREQLQAAGVNVAALSEVLELARFLDQRFGHTVPFGQVNLVHATAVLITLVPCDSLFDLIELVFDALPPTRGAPGPDGRPGSARGTPLYRAADLEKIRLFHCWAAIDEENAAALRDLQLALLNRPNSTLPLLLEVMPSLRHIHTAAHEAAVAAESTKGRVVEYNDGDATTAGASAAAPTSSGPVVASYDEDADPAAAASDDDDGEDDGAAEAPPEASAFWSALVAGPTS